MEERRRAKSGDHGEKVRGMSFDDIVDREGKLREEAKAAANTTAAETVPEAGGLRHRNTEAVTDSFYDERQALMDSLAENNTQADSPASLLDSPSPHTKQDLLINTSALSKNPAPTSSPLLTPTAGSVFSAIATPSMHTPNPGPPDAQSNNYFSVNEWAENSTSFYSPPRSVQGEAVQRETRMQDPTVMQAASDGRAAELAGLEVAMEELVNMSDAGGISDMDMVSEVGEGNGGRSTPGSWTEVGSVVSEFD